MNNNLLNNSKDYWLNNLSGKIKPVRFSNKIIKNNKYKYENYEIKFGDFISNRISTISKGNPLSEYVVLLTAFKILLFHYTEENDIIVGTSMLKNNDMGYNKYLLIRDLVDSNMTFKELLFNIKKTIADGYRNQDYPIRKVLDSNENEENFLFNLMFIHKDIHKSEVLSDMENELKSDLICIVNRNENELSVNLRYNISMLERYEVEKIGQVYSVILNSVLNNTEIKIEDINLISQDEKNKLLYEFNNKFNNINRIDTIHSLFEKQVEKNPHNIAISVLESNFNYTNITYLELNKKANQFANYLIKMGIKKGQLIAILTKQNIEMAIAMLGSLKAGAVYVPIDHTYPQERIKYIIKDSGAKVIVTNLLNETIYGNDEVQIINLNKIKFTSEISNNLDKDNTNSNGAYVIYTSGTTGKPKGTMIYHENIVNTLLYRKVQYDLNDKDVMLQLFSSAFDGFVTSFFSPLISSSKVILLEDDGYKNLNFIRQAIKTGKVSHFIAVPLLYKVIIENLSEDEISSVKTVVLAGDKVTNYVIDKTKERNKDIEIAVEYGVTECSVLSTIKRNQQLDESIKIGKPIDNHKIFILGSSNRLKPIGVWGELCISGVGVSSIGYLNLEQLTKEKFVDNPFEENQRLYKTGDIGRWMPNGELEFLDRKDFQVKIHGYRIELKEIENVLLKNEKVQDGIIVVRDNLFKNNDDKYICAYYVTEVGQEVSQNELKEYLINELPEYMIPHFFIEIEKIPLNSNGKVDIKELPIPQLDEVSEFIAPRDEFEKRILKIWAEILSIDEDQIGIDSNFFGLGGHSLKVTNMVAKIYKQLNVMVSIMEVFDNPTIRQLSKIIKEKNIVEYKKIINVERKDRYSLSPAQKRMFFLHQMDRHGVSYNLSEVLVLNGDLDVKRLQETLQKIINRHDSFRTSFHFDGKEYYQKINDYINCKIEHLEVISTEKEHLEEVIDKFMTSFDISDNSLIKVGLIKISDVEHLLLINMHHIISDGVSIGIFIKEFMSLYANKSLPEQKFQYVDYCEWIEKNQNSSIDYWKKRFVSKAPILDLPTDYQRSRIKKYDGRCVKFNISPEETKVLKEIALKENASMFMVVLSAYYVFLNKITKQNDIVVGVPISGRNHDELSSIIGMFVNTLPLRNNVDTNKSYISFLRDLRDRVIIDFENQDCQYESLVENLNIDRDISRNPLFDTMFIMQNMDIPKIQIPNLEVFSYGYKRKISKFDLTLQCFEENDYLEFEFEYSTDLFKNSTIDLFIKYFKTVLMKISKDSKIKIQDLEVISLEEKNIILNDFNNTSAEYPINMAVDKLFEQQVIRKPNAVAIYFNEEVMTYKELNDKSNQLARVLIQKGVNKNSLVGIMLNQSPKLIISIMAILKTGASYLPIDYSYPDSRIEYILKNGKVSKLVIEEDFINEKSELFRKLSSLELIDINKQKCTLVEKSNLDIDKSPEDPVYVIYTSGSSGKPKGVVVKSRGLTNYIWWASKNYINEEKLNFALFTSISFDLTVTSIYTPLVSGNSIVIYKNESISTCLNKIINDTRVGIIKLTPSHLRLMSNLNIEKTSIKKLILGGEALTTELAKDIVRKSKNNIEIYNEYGPTEATVGCMIYKYSSKDNDGTSVPIGYPIDNTEILILDENQKLVPIGVKGEIYISGDGLAMGYVQNLELTKEKFIANHFRDNKVMYKTGDLARMNRNGAMEFLGRIDDQVKIRGYRIELREIENTLLRHEKIRDAFVSVNKVEDEENKNLLAYIAVDEDISIPEIKDFLKGELPHYMIPPNYIVLDKIPLNSNGKIDLNALPKFEGVRPELGYKYIEPSTDIEKTIRNIWKEILGINEIGVNDNFFDLGGNSISILKVNEKLKETFNKDIALANMFAYPTISLLAHFITEDKGVITISDEELDESLELREQAILSFVGDEYE